jgi:hypothetical protein
MLQFRVPESIVVGYDMPMWGLVRPYHSQIPSNSLAINGGHRHDVESFVAWLMTGVDRCLDFGGYAQRLEYFGSPDLMAAFFPPAPKSKYQAGENDLIIHIRGGDILSGSIHRDYMPLPISFYERIICENATLNPIFMGQLGGDFYSIELRRRFPNALFIQQGSPQEDYARLNSAIHLVLSVSTFAWMAGWLSPNARTIHMPVLGFFNPAQRDDIDLLPKTDFRFRFYEFPVRHWYGTSEDKKFVMA